MHDDIWKTYDIVNDWIRFAEGKAVAILAAQGVLLAILSQEDWSAVGCHKLEYYLLVVAILALLMNLLSGYFAYCCLNPDLKLKGKSSPIFFGSIAKNFASSEDYLAFYEMSMSDAGAAKKEIADQVFILSRISMKKFINTTYALRAFLASLLLWAIYILSKMVVI